LVTPGTWAKSRVFREAHAGPQSSEQGKRFKGYGERFCISKRGSSGGREQEKQETARPSDGEVKTLSQMAYDNRKKGKPKKGGSSYPKRTQVGEGDRWVENQEKNTARIPS